MSFQFSSPLTCFVTTVLFCHTSRRCLLWSILKSNDEYSRRFLLNPSSVAPLSENTNHSENHYNWLLTGRTTTSSESFAWQCWRSASCLQFISARLSHSHSTAETAWDVHLYWQVDGVCMSKPYSGSRTLYRFVVKCSFPWFSRSPYFSSVNNEVFDWMIWNRSQLWILWLILKRK